MVSAVPDKNGGKLPFRTGNLIEDRLPMEPRTQALEFPSALECRSDASCRPLPSRLATHNARAPGAKGDQTQQSRRNRRANVRESPR
jgi:hypothetical protein